MIRATEEWLNSALSLAYSLLSLPMLMKRLLELRNIKYESNKPFWEKFAHSLGECLNLNQRNFLTSDITRSFKEHHGSPCKGGISGLS